MKAKIGDIEVEGNPSEVLQLISGLRKSDKVDKKPKGKVKFAIKRGRKHRHWTVEEEIKFLKLLREKASISRMAKELDRNRNQVAGKAYRYDHGLYTLNMKEALRKV